MMHKTCSINYGHLADLQKKLPTTDLNKKKLSFYKISTRDFYFFPFFSICTCEVSVKDRYLNSQYVLFPKHIRGGINPHESNLVFRDMLFISDGT